MFCQCRTSTAAEMTPAKTTVGQVYPNAAASGVQAIAPTTLARDVARRCDDQEPHPNEHKADERHQPDDDTRAGRHPLPSTKSEPDREDVTRHRRARGDERPGVVGEPAGDERRAESFRDIGHHDRDAPALPERAKHVRRANVLAPDGADIDTAQAPREISERDGSRQVSAHDDEQRAHGSPAISLRGPWGANTRRRATMK